MSNLYSPFQSVPEMGGAKNYFLKYWSTQKLSGNKVVGYCLEMPNQCTPFQYVPERGGAQIYFLKYWSRRKLSRRKVVGYCFEIPNLYFPFQYVPARGRAKVLEGVGGSRGGAQKFFPKISPKIIFLSQKNFSPKNCFSPNIFFPKNFISP